MDAAGGSQARVGGVAQVKYSRGGVNVNRGVSRCRHAAAAAAAAVAELADRGYGPTHTTDCVCV